MPLSSKSTLLDISTATIANGGTTSGAVLLADYLPVALEMPAAFTGTEITFLGSHDQVTYQPIRIGGSTYAVTVGASNNENLNPAAFLAYTAIKLVSNSAEGASRDVKVIKRRGDR